MDESTTTTTLTDFLVARIAEDEANYRALNFDSLSCSAVAMTVADIEGIRSGREPITLPGVVKTRLLAECEAKRRIVEMHSGDHACEGERLEWHAAARRWFYCRTLRALTLPYADHEDYREEWAPC